MSTEEQCRNIYRQAFKDNDTVFEDKLFKLCFRFCKVIKNSGEVAAMLFALPCQIQTADKILNAYYIYAAATLEKYRKQGYMKRLIQYMKTQDDNVLFLKPADKDLNEFYEKLSFTGFNASLNDRGKSFVIPDEDFKILAEGETDQTDDTAYTAMYYYKEKLDLDNLWFPYIMD